MSYVRAARDGSIPFIEYLGFLQWACWLISVFGLLVYLFNDKNMRI